MSAKAVAKKILIVEDEDLLVEMYREVFKSEGFRVATASNGQQALKVALKEKPDFILLDILLPGDSGISFLEQRQNEPKIAQIPVIAFSNFDDATIKNQAHRLGIKDYLLKTDYTPQEVVARVKECIA